MAIYISGVKGLPEQVQVNKEKINTIQDEIAGIDFEAIRELEEQVAENTEDINSLEGTIGTQNIAITNLGDRADTLEGKVATLENKTTQISYDEDNDLTGIGSVVKIHGNGEVEAGRLTATNTTYKDGEISNSESGIYLVQDGLTAVRIFNSHSGTTHTLDFNDDGSLEVDGNPVGKTYYEHNVCLSYDSGSNGHTHIFIQIESDDPTPFTKDTLRAYLKNAGFTSGVKSHLANGYYDTLTNAYQILGVYSSNGTDLQAIGYATLQPNMSHTTLTISSTYMGTLTDFVL